MLAQCLEHLLRSIRYCGRNDIEVIVTDDSAGPETAALVPERFPWAKWVAGPRGGPARNRNFGVTQSRGRWIVFTDDDCLPAERWLDAFAQAIGQSGGSLRAFEGRTVADREPQRLDEEAPVNPLGGYLWSCNVAVERTLFDRLGGFCELFPYAGMEDADFRVRLVKAGEQFRFVADAEVCHPLRPSKGLAFQLKVAPSFLLFARRHPELIPPWRTALLNFLRRLHRIVRLGWPVRFRGFGFALGSITIQSWFEVLAVIGARKAAR